MNFLAQQQAVADTLGLSLAITAQATQVQRYLNQAQRSILQAHDWPFIRAANPLVIQTATDYTTGTVATTAGSTSVTFSATIATSMTGRYLQTSSSNDWFRVSAHTAGTAAATLDTAAIYAAPAATYTLRKFYYSLTATPSVDRVISMRQSISPFQLMEMSKTLFEEMKPSPNTTGAPKLFLMAGKDTSATPVWQFSLWPIPDAVINIFVEYQQEPADLSASTDISLIPEKWRSTVMIAGACAFGYQSLGDPRFADAMNIFNQSIQAMKQEFQSSGAKTRIMRSVDQPLNNRTIPFPDNYPIVR